MFSTAYSFQRILDLLRQANGTKSVDFVYAQLL